MAGFLQGLTMGAAQEGTRQLRSTARVRAARKLAKEKASAQSSRETANITQRGGIQTEIARISAKGTTDAAKARVAGAEKKRQQDGIFGSGNAGDRLRALIPNLAVAKGEDAYANLLLTANEIYNPANTGNEDLKKKLNNRNSPEGALFQRLVTRAFQQQDVVKTRADGTTITQGKFDAPNVVGNAPWMKNKLVGDVATSITSNTKPGNDAIITPGPNGSMVSGQAPSPQKTMDDTWGEYNQNASKIRFNTPTGPKMYNESIGSSPENYAKTAASFDILADITKKQSLGSAIHPAQRAAGAKALVQVTADSYGGDFAGAIAGLWAGYPETTSITTKNVTVTKPTGDASAAGTRENQQELMSVQDNTIVSLTSLHTDYTALGDLKGIHGTQFGGGIADIITRLREELVGFKDAVPILKTLLAEGATKGSEAAQKIALKMDEVAVDSMLSSLRATNDRATAELEDTTDVSARAKLLKTKIAARETILVFSLVKSIQKGDKVSNEDFKLMRDALAGGKGFGKVTNRLPSIRTVLEEVISRKVDAGKLALIDNDGKRRGFANKMETAFYHSKYGPTATRASYLRERSAQLLGAPPPVTAKAPKDSTSNDKVKNSILNKAKAGKLGQID